LPGLSSRELGEILDLLPPAGAGLAVFVLGAWLSRRGSPAFAAAASVLAVGVACLWTFQRNRGAPAFPPRMSTERAFWAIAVACALGLAVSAPALGARARLLAAALAAPLAVVWVAGGFSSPAVGGGRLAAVSLGAVAWLVLLDRASACPGPLFGFVTAVSLGAAAKVFVMFRSALNGQMAGAAGITMGLIGLASLAFRRPLPAPVTIPIGAILAALSIDAAVFAYEPPPPVALIILAAAPLAPLVFFRGAAARSNPLRASLAAAALGLAVAGAGFFLAWRVAPPSFL
jgi:hypothetical protein